MRKAIFITIFCSLLVQSALAICNMNRYGHNICTGEQALLIKEAANENHNSLASQYEVVDIKKVVRDRTVPVVIKSKTLGEIEVDIDQLIGNHLCEEGGTCEGTKVVIKEECVDPNLKSKYKVVNSFRKDIVQLSTGTVWFAKSFLTVENCITPVN